MLRSICRYVRIATARIAGTLVIVLLLAAVVHACPTCAEGLAEADPQQQSVAAGFNYSILFMMSMPYLLLGSLGAMAYTSIRRAKLQNEGSTGGGQGGEA
jgi:hypothetical protein